jgi:hypothetical protein
VIVALSPNTKLAVKNAKKADDPIVDPPPVDDIDILPGPFVIDIPVPAVSVDDTGANPVLPMRSCPFVGGVDEVSKPDVPEYKNEFEDRPPTVRDDVIDTVEESDKVTDPVEEEALI